VASFLALVAAAAVRYAFRLWQEQRRRPSASTSRRVVVLGAGEAGAQIVRTMLRNPASPYLPVALLDDDPRKRALRLHGVRVEGCRDDLVTVAERRNADAVLLAIPSASGETLRSLAEPAFAAGIDVLVLPPVEQLLGTITIGDIRPLSEADLIERRPVEVDLVSITDHLTGRRILVTGAGGSIGSELCRQLDGIRPAALVMLDRDESGLHATQLAIEGRALLDSPSLVVADIRDRGWLLEVFTRHQPEVVFHTAALKHEPLLELHPGEAWKTNVLGTQNVLDAAVASGVQLFVNLSTDKAADPTSVLGASKRITERLTADAAQRTGRPYVSVRFGNVLGSRGSVLATFRAQIRAGGPITVTHPDATRFFMTVQEAVVLMIQAAALGEPGETMVLDMGTSVRIEHIARRLVLQGGRPVEIVYTGLRPGEKLHETLLNSHEPDCRPRHPLISHVRVPPLSLDAVEQLCVTDGSLHVRAARLIAAAQHGAWTAGAVANAPTTNERARRGG
jgi:FlaA1/EpsC-like NDP-sugar epimerase